MGSAGMPHDAGHGRHGLTQTVVKQHLFWRLNRPAIPTQAIFKSLEGEGKISSIARIGRTKPSKHGHSFLVLWDICQLGQVQGILSAKTRANPSQCDSGGCATSDEMRQRTGVLAEFWRSLLGEKGQGIILREELDAFADGLLGDREAAN
ncbi:hypothetical protein FGB62_218g015 [Gracilaria domingensis]|nr:hypothetical protein FGB62_218g015 [Gracilaria domingensis]